MQGSSTAKLHMFIKSLTNSQRSCVKWLPTSIYVKRGMDYFTHYLGLWLVQDDKTIMKLIRKNIRSLFSELLEENIEIWKDHVFNSITVPLSTVKHNLYKHTIKVTKGKKRSIPKKPRKPSKRIEILNSFEKRYIESYEQPWADLKDLNTTFKTGIPIYEADNLHRNMTEIISQQWNVVRKFTNYLTQKGKALTKLGRELGLRGTLNKNFKSEIISEVQRNAI
jgi:hypothetical protein